MKLQSTSIALCLLGILACQPASVQETPALEVQGSADYLQPEFADKSRVEKISAAFPITDEIFQKFA
ncbi:MAG: hypothetical protein RIA63_13885, partial [Cyclobacteriaceae bacterium]